MHRHKDTCVFRNVVDIRVLSYECRRLLFDSFYYFIILTRPGISIKLLGRMKNQFFSIWKTFGQNVFRVFWIVPGTPRSSTPMRGSASCGFRFLVSVLNLVVMQDRIFMENVGAVKELSKIASHLEARICELERNNMRYHSSWDGPAEVLSGLPRECKTSWSYYAGRPGGG